MHQGKTILVGGARLSSKGIHLGHYLGCFTPLINLPREILNYEYYFIINDVSNIELNIKDKEDSLINMVSDILSIDIHKNIRIFLQSDVLKHQSDFYSKIQKLTTFNQLINSHPHNKQIKLGAGALTVLDLLFPIRDAVTFLSLESDYVLMNDDNSRIVDFTRRIANKINNIVNVFDTTSLLKLPYLRTGFIPRLLGYNYKKMCNANNNAIYLTEEKIILERKVAKLINTRSMNAYIRALHPTGIPENFNPNSIYIPKIITELVGDTVMNFDFGLSYNGDFILTGDSSELHSHLFNVIDRALFKFRTKKQVFTNNRDIVKAKLRDDYYYLESLMNEFKKRPFLK